MHVVFHVLLVRFDWSSSGLNEHSEGLRDGSVMRLAVGTGSWLGLSWACCSWPPEHGSFRAVELFIWQLASPRMRKPRLTFHGLFDFGNPYGTLYSIDWSSYNPAQILREGTKTSISGWRSKSLHVFKNIYVLFCWLNILTVISAVNLNSNVIVNILVLLFTLMVMILLSPNMTFSFEV